MADNDNLKKLLKESRTFAPSEEFARQANLSAEQAKRLRESAERDYEGYWARLAREKLTWDQDFSTTLKWKAPFAEWFVEGRLNASAQCLDRQLQKRGNKTALIWHGEPVDAGGATLERRTYTYRQLHDEVESFAGGLASIGVKRGDRVAIYMPMIPEATVAILACARLGATHSVVFGGFSAEALRDRIQDAQASFVITASGGYRRGKVIALKSNVDAAVAQSPSVKKVVVVDRLGETGAGAYASHKVSGELARTPWNNTHDVWYHELLSKQRAGAVSVEAEHPLFILYTSGTTGKPKGVVHSTAGYMLWAQTTCEWVFDLKEHDVYWCTADIGWVTGHSYVVYGPLAAGATTVVYEGAPDFPTFHRFWRIIEREKVTIFYTAPTAIRAFMRQGEEFPNAADMSSLRLLGTVGEPINPEAWMWYRKVIGGDRCPIVDTWWQTETGATMISPLPGVTPTMPGTATQPLPGIMAAVVDKSGQPVPAGHGGRLVITKPWPSQLRTVYGDPERYKKQYWSEVAGPGGFENEPYYFTGDGAHCDERGYFWIMGRIDDVLNVAGHRLGTMEIESALVSNPKVAEAAVVGKPDELKGTAVCAFVTPKKEFRGKLTADELKAHVTKEIGAIARPDLIRFTDALPKTRSGKIMRRLLRDIASGRATVGDTTTLEDLSVLSSLRDYQDEG